MLISDKNGDGQFQYILGPDANGQVVMFERGIDRYRVMDLLDFSPADYQQFKNLAHKVGFMCKVDYECELGKAEGVTPIYPSVGDLRKHRTCVDECGIVKVLVYLDAVIQDENYSLYRSGYHLQTDDNT